MGRIEELQRLKQEHAALLSQLKQNNHNLELRLKIIALAQQISDLEEALSAPERMLLRFGRIFGRA